MDISISRTLLTPARNYTSTTVASSDFDEKLQAAHTEKTDAEQDLSYLSVGSYEQRLEKLWELHRNTDYSGMTTWEIRRLFDRREEQAFPEDYGAVFGGLYACLNPNSIYSKIMDEESRMVGEAFKMADQPVIQVSENAALWRYRKGYEGLSDDEIRAKINEKYNKGTLADRYGAAWELSNLEIDGEASGLITMQIYNELAKGTEQQYGHLNRDNPIRINAMIQYARETKVSWEILVNHTIQTITEGILSSKNAHLTEQEKQSFLWEEKSSLLDFLDHMNQI